MRSPWLLTACIALLVAGTVSCGRKTAPQVPDSPRPEVVKNITVSTRDTIAFLFWPIPVRNAEGKSMKPADIQRFRIYRAEMGTDKKKTRSRLYAEIDMTAPSPATVEGGTVFWSDSNLKYGRTYTYQIRAVSARGGVSALSEEVRATPLLSLAAPENLVAERGDGFNHIAWSPVTMRTDGSVYEGFVGFNLYRGMEPGRHDPVPLNKEPLRTTAYKDTAVVNARTYYYVARSVDSPSLPWRESLDSNEGSATPADMTPPDRPLGVTVVPGVGRVFLTWSDNKERDLAGYYIYRASGGMVFERLTPEPLSRTTYSDETASPGALYYYKITAVDRSGNESEGSEMKPAHVEKFR